MLERSHTLELTEILAKVNIAFNASKFDTSLSELNCSYNLTEIIKRIKKLSELITVTNDDYDGKRAAYKLLTNIYKSDTLNCLVDNKDYFKNISDEFDKIEHCLNAALVGSTQIAESLFDSETDPKKNSFLISYAICSGNSVWVKELVDKWEVNIKDPKYCFSAYAKRLGESGLVSYFEFYQPNKKKLFSSLGSGSALPEEIGENSEVPPINRLCL